MGRVTAARSDNNYALTRGNMARPHPGAGVDIGPRGPTTEGERRGAAYCAILSRPRPDAPGGRLTGATSIFRAPDRGRRHAAGLHSLPAGWPTSAAIAAVISLVALVSDLLELSIIDNSFRRIVAKGSSENVVAVVPPANEHRQDLVLIGHIDTQRTPRVFSTPRWVAIYKAFTTVPFVLSAGQVLLYILGAFTGWPSIWPNHPQRDRRARC